ncbi:MAG: helix-turn-helix domain-containing protein [Oricola sp.]
MSRHMQAEALYGLRAGAAETDFAQPFDGVEMAPPFARGRFSPAKAVAVCDGIVDLLSVFFNVSSRQLRSSKRTPLSVSRVRQIGMYVAHVTLGMRMTDIGIGFSRDKSTVVHACHTVEDLRDDEDFDLIVARVEKLVSVAFSIPRSPERRDG